MLKKISFKKPQKNKICIWSKDGESFFIERILSSCKINTTIEYKLSYHITIKILVDCLIFFIKNRSAHFKTPITVLSYSYALIKSVNPKVVLTLKGQSGSLYGELSNLFPSIKFISIPWTDSRSFYLKNMVKSNVEHYLFGKREKKLFSQYNINNNNIHCHGSFLGGFFSKNFRKDPQVEKYDLCIVSQVPNLFFEMETKDLSDLRRGVIKSQEIQAKMINRLAIEMGLSVVVAFRPQEHSKDAKKDWEKEFFEDIMKCNVEYIPHDPNQFSTYRAMDESKIIFSTYVSTTSIDALGWGKKVVFCDFFSHCEYWTKDLQWVLKSEKYKDFKNIVIDLLKMDKSNYHKTIKQSMLDFNPISNDLPLHEVLDSRINGLINK